MNHSLPRVGTMAIPAMAFSLFTMGVQAQVDIPEGIAGAPGSGREPGFRIRTVQGPLEPELSPTIPRGFAQLNGTLTGEDGSVLENEAEMGEGPGGTFPVEGIINFFLDPASIVDPIGNFPDDEAFPGIPGTTEHTANFTMEVITFLELTAGEHTLGGQVYIDRTDAGGGGNDDIYAVSTATNPKDYFATRLGTFSRSAGAPAFEAIPDDHTFEISVPEDGLYPVRLVYVQKVGAGTLEFYSVDDAGNRIPINDPDNAASIKAFQESTATIHNHPYLAEVRPVPGSGSVPNSDPLEILLIDDGAAVDTSTIQLTYNGVEITGEATITNADGKTSITYQPNPARLSEENEVILTFTDSAGREFTQEWDFQSASGGVITRATGLWNFDSGLEATVGEPLEYFDGADGITAEGTSFGTTTSFDIPDIDGSPANVMSVPPGPSNQIGYIMYHGLAPNGGGTLINQYTLIMDVYVSSEGPGFAGIIQLDNILDNSGDADFFWDRGNSNMGQGAGGYGGLNAFTPDEWHRIALAVDLAGDPPVVTKFVDGVKQEDWVQTDLDQPRRAMIADRAILFTDNDGEQHPWFVNSVQIREGKLSDVELEILGGPSASGIPISPFDDPNVSVQSQTPFGNLSAGTGVETRIVTIRNGGETEDLEVSEIRLVGSEAANYTISHEVGTLAPGDLGQVEVVFDPQGQSGLFQAAIEVDSNDAGDPLVSIDLTARIANPTGLIAHFAMDETEGEVMMDSSGQRYHGRYATSGSGSFTLGEEGIASGTSVAFNGSGTAGNDPDSGYAEILPDSGIPSLQSISYSLWVQQDPGVAGTTAALISKGPPPSSSDPFPYTLGLEITEGADPYVWFVNSSPVIQTEPLLEPSTPTHLVITHLDENGRELGATRSRLYVNGELVDELTEPDGFEDLMPHPIQFGALGGSFGFKGLMDDVQLYNRELSEEDVAFLFANPGQPLQPEGGSDLDSDGDGLTDEEEIALGTDPNRSDSDGDGQSDSVEVAAGSDPLDSGSSFLVLTVTRAEGSSVELTWSSVEGRTYSVETSSDLSADSWESVADGIVGLAESTSYLYEEEADASGEQYFRVVIDAEVAQD